MATILDQITVGDHLVFSLDTDPRLAAGTPAIVGTMAMVDVSDLGTTGEAYLKVGAADTAWKQIATSVTGNVPVENGDFRHLAVYSTDANGDVVNDEFDETSGGTVSVEVQADPTRTNNLAYRVPSQVNAITSANFVMTEGIQSAINGDKTFTENVTVNGNLDVNGTVTTIDTVDLQVTDKLVTLNRGGAAASGGEVGIEVEENAIAEGYFRTRSDREAWCLNVPAFDHEACLDFDKLTSDQNYHFPDSSGTFLLQPTAPSGVANQITWWLNGTTVTAETGVGANSLTWSDGTNFLGIQTPAPQSILQLFDQATTGTVAISAVILGKHSLTADIGAGALLAGGNTTVNEASGINSFVHGQDSIASGAESSAQGNNAEASGNQSHAEGLDTLASGTASHAEGSSTSATMSGSHAEGTSTLASGANAHSEGLSTIASGAASHAEGDTTTASGLQAHSEGNGTTASGDQSHAEGNGTTATVAQAHAEGLNSDATGVASHAEGNGTTASGASSHSEGSGTAASGDQAHAEGLTTTASGLASHAEGLITTASGLASHAAGAETVAAGDYSSAQGRKAQTGANAGAMSLSDSQDFTSTVDAADRIKMRYNNGWDLVKGGGANDDDGVNFKIRQATVNTVDATLTTLQTIAIPTDTTVQIKSKVVGARTGGTSGSVGDSASYERTTTYKNIGGTVTKHKEQSDYTYEDQSSWRLKHQVSGTNAIVEVRGAANNNVSWDVTSSFIIRAHF